MKNKRIISLLLVIAMMFTSIPVVFAADFTTSMSVSSTQVDKGSTITVTLSLSSSSTIAGVSGDLTFDSNKLEYKSYSKQGDFNATVKAGSDKVTIAVDSTEGVKSGKFISVSFKLKSDFDSGSTKLSFINVKGANLDTNKTVAGGTCEKTISIKEQTTPTTKSNDNKLSSLSLSKGTLSPAFSSNTANYEVSIPYDTDKVTVTAKANSSYATVKVNLPDSYEQGETSVITVVVTAQDGSKRTYTINVFRELPPDYVPSNDATLKELNPSIGILAPEFKPDVFRYCIDVDNETETFSFDLKTNFKRAKYNVLGPEKLSSNTLNVYNIVVTAEDKETSNIYTVVVRKDNAYSEQNIATITNDAVKLIPTESFVEVDLSSLPVQLVSPDLLNTLKKYDGKQLSIRTRYGSYLIDSARFTSNVGNEYYDLTILPFSNCDVDNDYASYETQMFSTNFDGVLPFVTTMTLETDITPEKLVNVYLFDNTDNTFYLLAEGVEVAKDSTVSFLTDHTGDLMVTEAKVEDAKSTYMIVDNEDEPEVEENKFLKFIKKPEVIAAGIAFILGLLIGFILAPKKKKKKKNKKSNDPSQMIDTLSKNQKKQKKNAAKEANYDNVLEKADDVVEDNQIDDIKVSETVEEIEEKVEEAVNDDFFDKKIDDEFFKTEKKEKDDIEAFDIIDNFSDIFNE